MLNYILMSSFENVLQYHIFYIKLETRFENKSMSHVTKTHRYFNFDNIHSAKRKTAKVYNLVVYGMLFVKSCLI